LVKRRKRSGSDSSDEEFKTSEVKPISKAKKLIRKDEENDNFTLTRNKKNNDIN
jgi:hypothetical protein